MTSLLLNNTLQHILTLEAALWKAGGTVTRQSNCAAVSAA